MSRFKYPAVLLVLAFGLMGLVGPGIVNAQRPAVSPQAFMIRVVDAETGRGVPLVELRTTNNIRYYTDSAGVVAFDEPGLMDQSVFFHVRSDGYRIEPEPFLGAVGRTVSITPRGQATIQIERVNIAERLYRVTGQGIYRDTVLLGETPPIQEPVLNARVVGQDSVQATVYKDRIFWVWGDTGGPWHPLAVNFRATGATSRLPEAGGLSPGVGVNLEYITRPDGFVKHMLPELPDPEAGGGLVWLSGLLTVPDQAGAEHLVAGYGQLAGGFDLRSRGTVVFNDGEEHFELLTKLDAGEPWRYPDGHATYYEDEGRPYWFFARPWPVVRVPATLEAVADPEQYEAFSCLMPGTEFNGPATLLERDENTDLVCDWKKAHPLTQSEELQLVNSGRMTADEARFQVRDVDTGNRVEIQRASIRWNDYRQKWVMIGQEIFGRSFLGETWFAESDSLTGPWEWARRIVTHDEYSFYNVAHHPFFDEDDGHVIYFEGTYTTFGTDIEVPTPRYDYNQIMYRLNLDDPRLGLPLTPSPDLPLEP